MGEDPVKQITRELGLQLVTDDAGVVYLNVMLPHAELEAVADFVKARWPSYDVDRAIKSTWRSRQSIQS